MIENVVKAFLIQLDFFPWKSKFFQKFPVVITAFVKLFQLFLAVSRIGTDPVLLVFFSKGGVGEDLLPAAFFLLCPLRIQLPQRMVIKCKKLLHFLLGKRKLLLFKPMVQYLRR